MGKRLVAFAALVGLSLLAAAGAISAQETGDESVGGDVQAAVEAGPAVVVVALDTPPLNPRARQANPIPGLQQDILDRVPDLAPEDARTFDNVPVMAVMLDSQEQLDALAAAPGVARIDLDVGGTVHLAQTVALTNADDRHALGNDGDGVVVAVLDSGVDSDHPDLIDDVVGNAQACFGFNTSPPGTGFCPNGTDLQTGVGAGEDDAGHGTHVAGIVSSNGTVASPGFAPGAEIVSVKVTDNCNLGGCFYSFTLNVVAALDYLIANPQFDVDVINMSLGTSAQFAGDCDNATSWTMAGAAAIDTLRANGVTAFASAGNGGSTTLMGAPACLSNVISVGASTDFDTPASFTDVSTTTDIFAPGVGVVASGLGGGTANLSGTSMASPSAAGCAALLIEAGEATTPDAIELALETSPTSILAANGLLYPRIDCSPSTAVCNGLAVTVDLGAGQAPTNGNDVILGTEGNDIINGLAGDDTICALGGDDLVNGGNGADFILGGAGQDDLRGNGGGDYLSGGLDNDLINGGAGDDYLGGGDGDDDLRGQSGADTIVGGSGIDQMFGGSGNDEMDTGPGGNLGTTQVVRGQGNNDTITGSSGNDVLEGGPGLDDIFGGAGNDVLIGGLGSDELRGDAGNDELLGGANRDFLYGGDDNDLIVGGTGDDDLFGENGVDDLNGQGGNDLCDGGAGSPDTATSTCETTVSIP